MIQKIRGTKDYFGEEAKKRFFVADKIRKVFEKYGYLEIVTPALEFLEVLKIKGGLGEESVKDIFRLSDKSGRELGLRFDLTTPVARFIQENNINNSSKIYYFGNVWRYERPQKGRLREFWQAGTENLGKSDFIFSDSENIIILNKILKLLGVKDFTFKYSSRKLLECLASKFKVKDINKFFRIVDKKDKISSSVWKKEISHLIKDKKDVNSFLKIIKGDYKNLTKLFKNDEEILKVIEDLKKLEKYCKKGNVSSKSLKFDLSLARGLDYYTGFIFEVVVDKFDSGSIAGGGRYDNLIGLLGKKKLPATGFSIGFDRLMEVVNVKVPENISFYFVTNDIKNLDKIISLREDLVIENVSSVVDFSFNISKGLSKASKRGFDFCVILGDEEIRQGVFLVKDLKKKSQKKFKDVKSLLKFCNK